MMKKGFTLIELLIVVAIIGILAAIAVPNFLNAQIRAKIARSVSDMRNLSQALEMYKLDENDYPPWNATRTGNNHPNVTRYYRLTTPVSYVSSIPVDPFASENLDDFDQWGTAYDYVNYYGSTGDLHWTWDHVYRLNAWGPDGHNSWGGGREFASAADACPDGNSRFLYNASNGLVSYGDIVWVGAKAGKAANMYCPIDNSY